MKSKSIKFAGSLLLLAVLALAARDACADQKNGPPKYVTRAEVPSAVEAELATRDIVCHMGEEGSLVIPKDALGEADLNGDGKPDYIITLCRMGCEKNMPPPGRYCDQSLLIISAPSGFQPIQMPGEILDIRVSPGKPVEFLSSAVSDIAACPVEDGVCNPIYAVHDGQIVQVGIE